MQGSIFRISHLFWDNAAPAGFFGGGIPQLIWDNAAPAGLSFCDFPIFVGIAPPLQGSFFEISQFVWDNAAPAGLLFWDFPICLG